MRQSIVPVIFHYIIKTLGKTLDKRDVVYNSMGKTISTQTTKSYTEIS